MYVSVCVSDAAVCMCELVLCLICISTSHHVAKTTSSVHLGGQEIKRWCKHGERDTQNDTYRHIHMHSVLIIMVTNKLVYLVDIKFTNVSIYHHLEHFLQSARTYRLSRPWTGAVDGVLADNTIWFVRR